MESSVDLINPPCPGDRIMDQLLASQAADGPAEQAFLGGALVKDHLGGERFIQGEGFRAADGNLFDDREQLGDR